MLPKRRAIQIGVKGQLKDDYILSILSIEDVTNLAHRVAQHHLKGSSRDEMLSEISDLPLEKIYQHEALTDDVMEQIGVELRASS